MNHRRTQSIPPNLIGGYRVYKKQRFPFQDRAKGRNDIVMERPMAQVLIPVSTPSASCADRTPESSRRPFHDFVSPGQATLSPEILLFLKRFYKMVETKITDCVTPPKDDDSIRAALNSAENLLRICIRKG